MHSFTWACLQLASDDTIKQNKVARQEKRFTLVQICNKKLGK